MTTKETETAKKVLKGIVRGCLPSLESGRILAVAVLNHSEGGIVNSPKGYRPGQPAESAEGCAYPTWVKDEPKKPKRAKSRKIKRL